MEDYSVRKENHIAKFLKGINEQEKAKEFSDDPQLIPLTKVARRIGLDSETLRRMVQKGEVKCKRIGKRYLIPLKEAHRLEYG